MAIPYFQVNAFVGRGFRGNPAGVCLLDTWLDETLMQRIARENDLSETAFLVPEGEEYRIRWMTPTVEVDLCGHATLASAAVVLGVVRPDASRVTFSSRSGALTIVRDDDRLAMDLPAWPCKHAADGELRAKVEAGLGVVVDDMRVAEDVLARVASESIVRSLDPDYSRLAEVGARGVVVTAPGAEVDFVSRFFVPACGVDEDPVTGSAHCMLTPYWSAELGRSDLTARQLSSRGGELWCVDRGDRVTIAGRAELYLRGELDERASFLHG